MVPLPALLQGVQIAMLRPRAMLDLLVADALNRGKIGLPRQFPKARGEPRGVDLVEPRHMLVHPCLADNGRPVDGIRSEEHTSELQSLMRISYAVFCLKKKNKITNST